MIDFTGKFIRALIGYKLMMFAKPRLEGYGWRDEVLRSASDLARGGRLPMVANAVNTVFGVDSTASKMTHFPVWFEPNRKVASGPVLDVWIREG